MTCKIRKARCELPDIEVEGSSDVALPSDKACHRCQTLSIECFVEIKRGGPARHDAVSLSNTSNDLSGENDGEQNTNLFHTFSVTETPQSDEQSTPGQPALALIAGTDAERQIYQRCLDLVGMPLDLLKRLLNAKVDDNAPSKLQGSEYAGPVNVLEIVDEQMAKALEKR